MIIYLLAISAVLLPVALLIYGIFFNGFAIIAVMVMDFIGDDNLEKIKFGWRVFEIISVIRCIIMLIIAIFFAK